MAELGRRPGARRTGRDQRRGEGVVRGRQVAPGEVVPHLSRDAVDGRDGPHHGAVVAALGQVGERLAVVGTEQRVGGADRHGSGA
ncbi:hypothetical protein [Asanoa sp. NPDC050611]|uniref:hypothetical protein n=1 Tax=Asanoa sp. NPDC050611 TaxID=3157098 RepID=UPI0033EE848B